MKMFLPVVLLFLPLGTEALSETISVRLEGGGDFSEIQNALDFAADGDTVLMGAGEHTVRNSLDFNRSGDSRKNLIVRSESGPLATVIRMSDEPLDPSLASVFIFRSGDTDASGQIDISDCVVVLLHLFQEARETSCLKTFDFDDNGSVEITDPIFGLTFLFLGGFLPPDPFADCGFDPTSDQLTCSEYDAC